MTRNATGDVVKTAEAVAVLYAKWPAFRMWMEGRMSHRGSSRNGARQAPLSAQNVGPDERDAFLGCWHERAGEAWTTVGELADFATDPAPVLGYVAAGQSRHARIYRTSSVLRGLARTPVPLGGTLYRLERERHWTDRHKPRWRLVRASAEHSDEDAAS